MNLYYHASTTAAVSAADATDLASASALVTGLAAALVTHFADAGAHYAADATTYAADARLDPGGLRTAANGLCALYNAHAQRKDLHLHGGDRQHLCTYDTRNGSNEETYALLNALKAAANLHFASGT